VRFGIFDHMELRGEPLGDLYAQRLELLEVADALGFWCYHKAEHHFTPLDAAPSSNLLLAAAAQRTERIRFGPLVYLLPFYDPLRLLEEICTLDHLSGGRLEVGVGKGISPAEHRLWGFEPEEARDRFEETFAILRAGLGAKELSHKGAFHQYDAVPVVIEPQQQSRPPFWYPGNIEYAGRHRLNTVSAGPAPVVAQAAARFAELTAAPEEDWNPGVAEPSFGVTSHVFVAQTDEAALARVRQAFPKYHENLSTLFRRYDVPYATGDPSLGGDAELALQVGALVAGTPDTVAKRVEDLADIGVNYVIGSFAWGDLDHAESLASLRLFAKEVMPRFRA